jgi:hypothetical protein
MQNIKVFGLFTTTNIWFMKPTLLELRVRKHQCLVELL